MGYALAQAAKARGARVILISGPTHIRLPLGINIIQVQTAEQMRQQVLVHLRQSSVVIMASAVSDFRPLQQNRQKIKKKGKGWNLHLEPTADILREISQEASGQLLIGFAAESENLISNAAKKLNEKGLHLIIANDISLEDSGFESDYNIVTLLDKQGQINNLPRLPKTQIAEIIMDKIEELLKGEK